MNFSLEYTFEFLNDANNNQYVLLGFIALCVVILALRMVVCVGYQTQLTLFQLNAKNVEKRTDLKETKSGLLNRIIKDYVKIAEKGIGHIEAKTIVDKHVRKLHVFGWGLESITHFVVGFTQGLLLIGILLSVVFPDYGVAYAITTVVVFVVMRLMDSIFDFKLVKEKLVEAISEYVNREVGQFYVGDMVTVVVRLRNELSASILQQSDALAHSIDKMGENLAGVLKLSIQEMSGSIADTVSELAGVNSALKEPLELWRISIEEAGHVQKQINEACSGLGKMLEASKTLAENISANQTVQDAVSQQLNYIEKNQVMLNESLVKYETSLEQITQKMGTGFGSMVAVHIQGAYQSLNDNLQDNLKQITNSNNETMLKLQQLFESMHEQSKLGTQAIVRLKDQIGDC